MNRLVYNLLQFNLMAFRIKVLNIWLYWNLIKTVVLCRYFKEMDG